MKCQIYMANLVYVASSALRNAHGKTFKMMLVSSVDFICGLNITFNSNAIYCFLFCILHGFTL